MNSTLIQAAQQFPSAFAKRSIEAQLEFVEHLESEVRASALPVLARMWMLTNLEFTKKLLQLPAVFTGKQAHFKD